MQGTLRGQVYDAARSARTDFAVKLGGFSLQTQGDIFFRSATGKVGNVAGGVAVDAGVVAARIRVKGQFRRARAKG